jgi:hypothetical protein
MGCKQRKSKEFHGDFSSKDVGFEMFEPNINGNFKILKWRYCTVPYVSTI